ncbi:hypothetical protein HMPREF9140_00160 [Prevotella micans F0438]|jgi:hypothetical protein|uniref:SGNH hydrolase-type esterase domain-containing protein n=1 Tax=Prevotella micans F0438 TaxID=883158 RepID=H1PZS2_9BACT|nr:GDSL-type esterase/lipase family protein [Prevotella micans]EHO74665.1 hypothetical protein HMPREF9140_00160 [Prevotella micans F0438]
MKDNAHKPLALTVLVVFFLVLLHFLPKTTVGGMELREIDILSSLSNKKENSTELVPKIAKPKQIIVRDKNGRIVNFKEKWPKGTERILDFSQGADGGMDNFYSKLTQLAQKQKQNNPVRIAYYGDSFIEGDILLADLREMLQKKYGGYGVGWIDAGNELNQYKHVVTNKFSGLTEHLVKKPAGYNVAEAGLAERYYTMKGNAEIKLTPFSTHEYPHTDKWTSTKLYLRSRGGATVIIQHSGSNKKFNLPASPKIQYVEALSPEFTSMANIKVNGRNTILFGTAQESEKGVVIDNFSMRGSSGTTLARLPQSMLKQFAEIRPYDLIVLQFGVNVIGEKVTSDNLKRYVANMKTVVMHFRNSFPKASILVVSTPDRGSKRMPNGTMRGIEMLAGYQEKLASDCKVGFYSLFHAMGGPGTMMRIVDQNGMGTKDYVHINYKGGKYVAKRIYNSIVAGQQNYARRQNYNN